MKPEPMSIDSGGVPSTANIQPAHNIKKDSKVRVMSGFWEGWRGIAIDQKWENGIELINVKLLYKERSDQAPQAPYHRDFMPFLLEVIQ